MIYAVNVPIASYTEAALVAYHFASFCAQFPIVYVSGANFAGSTMLETSSGSVNSSTPSRLYSSTAVFTGAHVNKFVAVRDTTNPENTCIVRITAYVSATQVQLNAPIANFTTSGTVSFRIFDMGTVPSPDDFFVFSNLSTGFPGWQCACRADSGSTTLTYEVGPIGGFNTGTGLWTGLVTSKAYGWTTVAQMFCVSEPAQGWMMSWTEDVGGVGSNRNAAFAGAIASTHATPANGFPADSTYAGVMGSTTVPTAHNLDRTLSSQYFSTGEVGGPDGSAVVVTKILKMYSAGASDVLTSVASTNPRSGATDDFDAVLGQSSSDRCIHGYLPGVRMLNDAITNRTLVSGGAVYALGDGFGIEWNGKPVV